MFKAVLASTLQRIGILSRNLGNFHLGVQLERLKVPSQKRLQKINGSSKFFQTLWNDKALHGLAVSFDFDEISFLVAEEIGAKVNITFGGNETFVQLTGKVIENDFSEQNGREINDGKGDNDLGIVDGFIGKVIIENDSLIGESMEAIDENEQGTNTFKRDKNMEESKAFP